MEGLALDEEESGQPPDRPGLGNRQQMEEECGAGQTRLRGSEEDPGLGAKPFNIRGPVPLLDSRGN